MSEKIIERELYHKIRKFLHRKEMFGIRGPRQVGKTTLMKKIFSEVDGKKEFINLENFLIRRELERDPLKFIKRYDLEEGGFLFLDEVQLLNDGGSILKLIYDTFENLKIIFSGSSSLEIKTNILPKLTGRLWLFDLFSFSFEEFLSYKDKGLAKLHKEYKKSVIGYINGDSKEVPFPVYEKEFLDLWDEYCIYGGYPEVVKAEDMDEKKLILSNIISLHIEKDIRNYFGIEDEESFFNFIKFLSSSISSPTSIHSISSILSQPRHKIEKYLMASIHSYIVSKLKPYSKGKITNEIKKSPKIYFLDTGIRNAVLGDYSSILDRADKGSLLENFIFNEFKRTGDFNLNYWRNKNKNEIDFIVSKANNVKIIAECKFSFDKVPKTMYHFMDQYGVERAIIFTYNNCDLIKKGNKEIYILPAYYL